MSRLPVYPLDDGSRQHDHDFDATAASAYGNVAAAAAELDGAITGSLELVRRSVRRVQGLLTRRVNGGLRGVDANVRQSAEQLDSRIAHSTAELAGRLRGINGVVGTSRAVADELDRTRPALPAVTSVDGSLAAAPIFLPLPPAARSDDGRPDLGSFVSAAGAGDFVSTTEGILPPPSSSNTAIGVTFPDDEPPGSPPLYTEPSVAPPLHPDATPTVRPVPGQPCPAIYVTCPAPVVRVTVLPAPVQVVPGATAEPQPTDAFTQGPPGGGGETVGFNPGWFATAGRGDESDELQVSSRPPPQLPDPTAVMQAVVQSLTAILQLLR